MFKLMLIVLTLVQAHYQPQCDCFAHKEAMKLVDTSTNIKDSVEHITDYLGYGCLNTAFSKLTGMPMSNKDPFSGFWHCKEVSTFPKGHFTIYINQCVLLQVKTIWPGPGVYPIPGLTEIAALKTCLDKIPYIARLHQYIRRGT